MLIIPFRNTASWRQQIQLEGVIFFLAFKWNALNEFWTMDIFNINEEPLIYGIKIVPDFPLLSFVNVLGMPRGNIICQNVVNGENIIKRFDMNQKFALFYYSEIEILTLFTA